MTRFEKAQFCIDAISAVQFDGYTNGDTWNGWACPRFEKQVAENVLNASISNGYLWSYNAERDVYIVKNEQDPPEYEPEEFEGQIIMTNDGEVQVYPIGAYSWIWELCE